VSYNATLQVNTNYTGNITGTVTQAVKVNKPISDFSYSDTCFKQIFSLMMKLQEVLPIFGTGILETLSQAGTTYPMQNLLPITLIPLGNTLLPLYYHRRWL